MNGGHNPAHNRWPGDEISIYLLRRTVLPDPLAGKGDTAHFAFARRAPKDPGLFQDTWPPTSVS